MPIIPVAGRRTAATAGTATGAMRAELILDEPIRIRSHYLRLAPDGRRRSRGQRRRDHPASWTRAADSDIVLFPSCASPATPAPTCSASRRSWRPASQGGPDDRRGDGRADGSWWSSGCPIPVGNSLFNCAVVIGDGAVLGIVPKQFLPNYKEFYESRWFSPADGPEPAEIELGGRTGAVRHRSPVRGHGAAGNWPGRRGGRDLRGPLGADPAELGPGDGRGDVLLNLSASNETIGKSRYRTDLVVGQSGRCDRGVCLWPARARRNRRPTSSSAAMPDRRERPAAGGVAPGRRRPARPPRFVLHHPGRRRRQAPVRPPRHRPASTTAAVARGRSAGLPFALADDDGGPEAARARARRSCPREGPELHRRCAEIFGIQCAGLAKRIEQLPAGHAAQHRHLGRARFHAGAPGRRQDLRHAGPRPPADPRPDDARLRHDAADPDQRAGPDGTPGRLGRDDRHQRRWPSRPSGDGPRPLRHRLPRAGRRSPSARPWRACPARRAAT